MDNNSFHTHATILSGYTLLLGEGIKITFTIKIRQDSPRITFWGPMKSLLAQLCYLSGYIGLLPTICLPLKALRTFPYHNHPPLKAHWRAGPGSLLEQLGYLPQLQGPFKGVLSSPVSWLTQKGKGKYWPSFFHVSKALVSKPW